MPLIPEGLDTPEASGSCHGRKLVVMTRSDWIPSAYPSIPDGISFSYRGLIPVYSMNE